MKNYTEIDLVETWPNTEGFDPNSSFCSHNSYQQEEPPSRIRKLAVVFDQETLKCLRNGIGNAPEIMECHHNIEDIREGFEDDYAALNYNFRMLAETLEKGANANTYSDGNQFIRSEINWTNIEQYSLEMFALAVSNQTN